MAHEHSASSSEQDISPSGANAAYYFMDKARQKYKANPQLLEPVHLPGLVPTPEELDYDERLDRALARSNIILQEVTEQLEKTSVAPDQLAPSERAEKESAEAWTRAYKVVDRTSDEWVKHDQQHHDEFIADMDELEAQNVPIPVSIDVPTPRSPSINQLAIRDQSKHYLRGSWNFREYRDEDFAAAQRAEHHTLQRPWAADLTGHSRASSEPPSSMWKGAGSFGGALQGKLTRSSLSIRHRVTSSVGAIALQNVFKIDKAVKW